MFGVKPMTVTGFVSRRQRGLKLLRIMPQPRRDELAAGALDLICASPATFGVTHFRAIEPA